jgi:hypothetical protein
MNLLYCSNGVVLAIHDNSQAAVPASQYGEDVRVIPYDQPLNTLDRVGEPPPQDTRRVPMPDTRPYAQPAATPAILRAFAGQVRWQTVTSGFTFKNVPANTDRISQTLIANLAQYALTISKNQHIDFTQDGVAYSLTAQDVIDMNNQFSAQAQTCRTIEAQCLADLNSASPTITTYEDVEARFAGVKGKKGKKGKK